MAWGWVVWLVLVVLVVLVVILAGFKVATSSDVWHGGLWNPGGLNMAARDPNQVLMNQLALNHVASYTDLNHGRI